MIELCDDCEYTVIIADLIATLMTLDKDNQRFKVKIWVGNVELPFLFDNNCNFDFLQEGLRVEMEKVIDYIFYDLISLVEVVK